MGKVTGFLEFERQGPAYRPVPVRLRDWREVYQRQDDDAISQQGARCMDCGIPFCMQGCPLGNRIPAFNDAVYNTDWLRASEQLFRTNNFPEFTGRLCPAPCESACVLGIGSDPVTIERIEYEVAEHAFQRDLPVATFPAFETGKRVAVVGSGPAGLAGAAQLRSVGHAVTVYERSDALGGLLRYGIPEFKMEKSVLDRRIEVMRATGIKFHTNVSVGDGGSPLADLQRNHDAVLLAIGSTIPRLIEVPGADLNGVLPAMTYLEAANRAVRDSVASPHSAQGLHVIILGGGDTGADCLGTAHRQGAASVTQIEILDRPPDERPKDQPWPTMARLYKTTSAHEEGGERLFSTETLEFVGDGALREITLLDHTKNQQVRLAADMVLIAAGFTGPEIERLGLNTPSCTTARNTLQVGEDWRVPVSGPSPVFACGDAVRGQSLIVWAIAEGRSAAAAIDQYLSGTSVLPSPLTPYSVSW